MSLGSMEQRTEGMKRQAQELIEQAYHKGFKAGREDRQDWETSQADRLIEKGMNMAWEAARKILNACGRNNKFLDDTFGVHAVFDIINTYSAPEAIEKIREWEEKQTQEDAEIKVGDEVRVGEEGRNAFSAVVHLVGDRGDCIVYQCISANGLHYTCTSNDAIRKTGRTFPEIAEVLKKMQEGEL